MAIISSVTTLSFHSSPTIDNISVKGDVQLIVVPIVAVFGYVSLLCSC